MTPTPSSFPGHAELQDRDDRRATALVRERLPVRRHRAPYHHQVREQRHRRPPDSGNGQLPVIIDEKRIIEPLGEAKSDYEAVCLIAEKLGLLEEYTGGQDGGREEEVILKGSGYVAGMTSYERGDWSRRATTSSPATPIGQGQTRLASKSFYEDPSSTSCWRLPPASSSSTRPKTGRALPRRHGAAPGTPLGGVSGSHDERISSERAQNYSLLVLSNHPRWRMHAQGDDITWCRELPTGKVRGFDGYQYEPLWMNPSDAAARGIQDGDIVKVYNERGIVLAGAYVSERVMPGAVFMDHGGRYDPICPPR